MWGGIQGGGERDREGVVLWVHHMRGCSWQKHGRRICKICRGETHLLALTHRACTRLWDLAYVPLVVWPPPSNLQRLLSTVAGFRRHEEA